MSEACSSCKLVRAYPGGVSTDDAQLSYERLAAIRATASQLRDSGVVYLHEQSHLNEIISRLDAAVRLKGEREADQAKRSPLIRMPDPVPDDGADGAGVVIFRRPRTAEDEAREIAGQFPGWHVWYTPDSDTWNAHREGEEPFFGRRPGGSHSFMVSAYDAPGLITLLELQDRAVTGTKRPGCWIGQAGPGEIRPRSGNVDGGTAAEQRHVEP